MLSPNVPARILILERLSGNSARGKEEASCHNRQTTRIMRDSLLRRGVNPAAVAATILRGSKTVQLFPEALGLESATFLDAGASGPLPKVTIFTSALDCKRKFTYFFVQTVGKHVFEPLLLFSRLESAKFDAESRGQTLTSQLGRGSLSFVCASWFCRTSVCKQAGNESHAFLRTGFRGSGMCLLSSAEDARCKKKEERRKKKEERRKKKEESLSLLVGIALAAVGEIGA